MAACLPIDLGSSCPSYIPSCIRVLLTFQGARCQRSVYSFQNQPGFTFSCPVWPGCFAPRVNSAKKGCTRTRFVDMRSLRRTSHAKLDKSMGRKPLLLQNGDRPPHWDRQEGS